MRSLVYTNAAQEDLVALSEMVTLQEGEDAATETLERLLFRCEDLARYPDMGRRRSDLDAHGLSVRTLNELGRMIVYARRGNAIVVARVLKSP